AAHEGLPPVRLRVLRPLQEPLGHLVLDGDLRQPQEEPRLLPQAARMSTIVTVHAEPRSTPRRPLLIAGGLVAAALAPLVVGQASTALHTMILAAAYVIMALGLNIVVGFAGLLDLGYVAFYAIGAHVAAYFGSAFFDIHLDFLLIAALAMAACTIA